MVCYSDDSPVSSYLSTYLSNLVVSSIVCLFIKFVGGGDIG